MGEKSNPSFTHQVWYFCHELSYTRLLLMIQLQILVGDLHNGHLESDDVIRGNQQFFANKSRSKRATCMGVVSLNSSCRDASPDMQHDLFGSKCVTLTFVWPWSEIKHWPYRLRSPGTRFDEPWWKEHDGGRIRPLAFLVQKLFAQNIFAQKSYFGLFYP